MKPLYAGAIKNAVSSATSLILSLPVLDPDHFSVYNWKGILHMAGIIIWVIIVGESRYWKDWADNANGTYKPTDTNLPKV